MIELTRTEYKIYEYLVKKKVASADELAQCIKAQKNIYMYLSNMIKKGVIRREKTRYKYVYYPNDVDVTISTRKNVVVNGKVLGFREAEVYKCILENGKVTVKDIMKKTNLSRDTIYRKLMTLRRRGLIKQIRRPDRTIVISPVM